MGKYNVFIIKCEFEKIYSNEEYKTIILQKVYQKFFKDN